MLKDDIWPNPLQYYLSPEVNGVSDDSSSESNEELDDSVVVVGDDDDDDDGMFNVRFNLGFLYLSEAGSSLTGATALWSLRHIYPSLVLV